MAHPRATSGSTIRSRIATCFAQPPALEFIPARVRRLLQLQAALVVLYVAGRVVLPIAGSSAVEILRLAVGLPMFLLAAALCWLRSGVMQRDRLAWRLLAVAIVGFCAGSLATKLWGTPSHAPIAAYVGWTTFYVGLYAALVLMARSALRPFPWSHLLDAVAAVLGIAAIVSSAFDIVGSLGYRGAEAVLALSYPMLDVVLLAFVAWISAAGDGKHHQPWRPILWALVLILGGDVVLFGYAVEDHLSTTAPYTAFYPVAMSALAIAAWVQPPVADTLRSAGAAGFRAPMLTAAAALAVILLNFTGVVDEASGVAAAAALLVVFARLVIVYRDLASTQQSRRFQQGYEDAGIGMALLDGDGRWLQVNTAMANLLGMRAEAMVGTTSLDRVVPEHRAKVLELMGGLRDGADRINPVDLTVITPSGVRRDVLVAGDVIAVDGADLQLFAQVQDVTLERLARRYSAVMAKLSQSALVSTDKDALLQEISMELRVALGCDVAAMVLASDPNRAARVLAEAGMLRPGLRTALADAGHPVSTALTSGEVVDWNDLQPGAGPTAGALLDAELESFTVYPVMPSIGPPAALCIGYSMARSSATPEEIQLLESVSTLIASAMERTRREEQARHDALHDPLTGLANRALINAHLSHVVEATRREPSTVGCVLVDLDRFKNINDALGHGAGDALLVQVAARLSEVTRGRDLVARLGGDEFVIVVDRVDDLPALEEFAARLVASLREPFPVGDRELYVEASLGIAVGSAPDASAETLLRDADVAMYRAKADGGSRYAMFDEELRADVVARSDTEHQLRHAVTRGELRFALQPQIHLDGVTPVSFESLVRWARPGTGLVSPVDFVQVAEDTGLIVPLGTWVLQESVAWAARAASINGTPPVVSVNVSARQLTDEFPGIVAEALAAADLLPQYLCLELTESMLIASSHTDAIIAQIRALGVSLSLDDFGTGFSSLAALQRLQVDELKLDRSMVIALDNDDSSAAITRAAAQMALALDLLVVAEGIETPKQLRAVRELGCQVAQGFLFSRPLWPDDAERYLEEESWRALLAGVSELRA